MAAEERGPEISFREREMFKRTSHVLLATVALLAAVSSVRANVSFSSQEGAVNKAGQPVAARADFTIKPDMIVVRLTNTGSEIISLDQALAGLSFQV